MLTERESDPLMNVEQTENNITSNTLLKNLQLTVEIRKKLLAEFIGTFFLIFAGTGAIVVDSITNQLSHLGVCITFGLTVMVLIYAFGHISGAHFNPAVTISFLILGEVNKKEAFYYIITQFIAAICASSSLFIIFGNVANLGATLPAHSWQQGVILEFILTFILMMVILASAIHRKSNKTFAGIAIGGTVGLEALFGGPISGASMNPARSLGPALVSGSFEHLWIYLIITTLGAIVATYLYRYIQE